MISFWIQEVFLKCLEINKEFEIQSMKKKSCNPLYISENEIWECNNERNGKVFLNHGIIVSLVIIHTEYAIVK